MDFMLASDQEGCALLSKEGACHAARMLTLGPVMSGLRIHGLAELGSLERE